MGFPLTCKAIDIGESHSQGCTTTYTIISTMISTSSYFTTLTSPQSEEGKESSESNDSKEDTVASQFEEKAELAAKSSGKRDTDAPQHEEVKESSKSSKGKDDTVVISTSTIEIQYSTHTPTMTLSKENRRWSVQYTKDIYNRNVEWTERGGFKWNNTEKPHILIVDVVGILEIKSLFKYIRLVGQGSLMYLIKNDLVHEFIPHAPLQLI